MSVLKRFRPDRADGRTSSLRAQLLLATATPMVLLLLAVAVVSMLGFTRLTQALVERRDAELAHLAVRQVANHWADSVLLLAQFGSSSEVREGDLEGMQNLLEASLALRRRFDRLGVTDANGNLLTMVGGPGIGDSLADYAALTRARNYRRPVRSEIVTFPEGQEAIIVAVPAFGERGHFAGCVVGIWLLGGDVLGQAIEEVEVGERGLAYLVDEDGTILYHPDAAFNGANAARHPAVSSLLEGNSGAQTVRVEGERVVVGYAPIPLRELSSSLFADETWAGWGLVTSERWIDIIAPLRSLVIVMISLLVLLVGLPMIVLAYRSHQVTAPLQSLVSQVERVSSGEFDSQVSVNAGPSEVRDLEIAFNRMVGQLREYQRDIQSYVVSVLNSQEDERKRIARELHDETAQALIVLGRQVEAAEEAAESEELIEQLSKLRDMVDHTLHGVRRFTSDLRPPLLEELGLPRTLEILGGRVGREVGLDIEVEIKGEPQQLLPELELAIYRLAQESLNNVRRHAEAQHARVVLKYGSDAVELYVSDDGIGFDVPEDSKELMRSGRLGLMGMYERARLFGGRTAIESKESEGTKVSIYIPISPIATPLRAEEESPQEFGEAAD